MSPVSTPDTEPICNAVRRPRLRASQPIGSVLIHMPSTKTLIGSVASPLSGASMVPTMPAVATRTVLLPPASACATDSTSALRRASRSLVAASTAGSASADINRSPKGGFAGTGRPFSGLA